MTDRKKPGVAFLATVVLVVLLVAYPLSFGPACWVNSRNGFGGRFVLPILFQPILRLGSDSESLPGAIIVWYTDGEIRKRSHDGLRFMGFMGCVIVLVFSFLATWYRDRDYVSFILWNIPVGIVAWVCRPWHRAADPPPPDSMSESN
jgi:hypothetical protein